MNSVLRSYLKSFEENDSVFFNDENCDYAVAEEDEDNEYDGDEVL